MQVATILPGQGGRFQLVFPLTHSSVDGHLVVSTFWLLWIMLLWTLVYKYLWVLALDSFGYIPRSGIAGSCGYYLYCNFKIYLSLVSQQPWRAISPLSREKIQLQRNWMTWAQICQTAKLGLILHVFTHDPNITRVSCIGTQSETAQTSSCKEAFKALL